jgi:hypothetical protein
MMETGKMKRQGVSDTRKGETNHISFWMECQKGRVHSKSENNIKMDQRDWVR